MDGGHSGAWGEPQLACKAHTKKQEMESTPEDRLWHSSCQLIRTFSVNNRKTNSQNDV